MAIQTYVPSQYIHIFPCATRIYNNTASKFLTQYNLTHFVGSGKSYNLTKSTDAYMRFSVDGYFVQIDYKGQTWWEEFLNPTDPQNTSKKPTNNQLLYAYISLSGTQPGTFNDSGDVSKQARLTPFESYTTLDQSQIRPDEQKGPSIFTALKLAFVDSETDLSDLSAKVRLAKVVSTDTTTKVNDVQWQLYSESLTFDNSHMSKGIKIELSQNSINKNISAIATQVLLGTDELKIDTNPYGTTTASNTTNPDRLKVLLTSDNKKLKAQLQGLVTTDDIANNAVTYDKLNVNTSAGRDTDAQKQLGARVLQDGSTGNLKAQLVGKVQTGDIAPKAVTKTELHSDIQEIVDHPGQLKITTRTGTKWYSARVQDNILYIQQSK